MIKNYFIIGMRNLIRNKSYSLINISGLAIGMAACLLIFVVVQYELSYDKFQKNYDRIFRVITNSQNNDGSIDKNSGIPCPAYDAFKTEFPQLEKIAPLASRSQNQVTVLGKDINTNLAIAKKFLEPGNMAFTYPDYFEIFSTQWLAGNPQSLSSPGNVVLDKAAASKYFGDWKEAMGQFIKIDNQILVQVSGIIETTPENSDFPIPIFLSYEDFKKFPASYNYSTDWGNLSSNHQVYILLPVNLGMETIQKQLDEFANKHYSGKGIGKRKNLLQPLAEMHFDFRYSTLGDHSSSKTILWTLTLIGILIIIMASINFVNLSTAQAVGRSKEVGIRKVLGSLRGQLIAQVMGETFIIVLLSLVMAIGIAELSLPYLSQVASVPATITLFSKGSLLFLLIVLIIVTLLSGIYPALIVSGFRPILALKSKINSANVGGISLRRVLVVTQFAISQVLIVGTIVAVSQMNYVRQADLGFNKEAVLMVPTFSNSANKALMKPLKQELLQNPNVVSVSFASDEASSDNNWSSNFAYDNKEDADFPIFHKFGDEDYIKTFGLQFIAGKAYRPCDTIRELVINETLVRKLGISDPEKIIGKNIRLGGSTWVPVVGVVKDFKTNSLREEIKPLAIAPRQKYYYTIAIKLRTSNLPQTTAQIQKLWEKTYPKYVYTSHFVDETIEQYYRQETQLSLLYKIFACIAIFISCLGLYGLVSFMATQKTKEVGVRKVLGASIGHIVYMFSREFTLLIAIAFLLAAPVAWYMMSNWLQNFEFRINMGIGVFALAIIVSLVIAWITVGYKAVRAAVVNPVKALRTE